MLKSAWVSHSTCTKNTRRVSPFFRPLQSWKARSLPEQGSRNKRCAFNIGLLWGSSKVDDLIHTAVEYNWNRYICKCAHRIQNLWVGRSYRFIAWAAWLERECCWTNSLNWHFYKEHGTAATTSPRDKKLTLGLQNHGLTKNSLRFFGPWAYQPPFNPAHRAGAKSVWYSTFFNVSNSSSLRRARFSR